MTQHRTAAVGHIHKNGMPVVQNGHIAVLYSQSEGSSIFQCQCVTGDYRTQFHVKAERIAEALSAGQYNFGFLHIKAVDDTGHDQQPVLKVCCHISW